MFDHCRNYTMLQIRSSSARVRSCRKNREHTAAAAKSRFLYLLNHSDLNCDPSSIHFFCVHRHVDQFLHQLQVLRIRNSTRA